jgi:hypothetical protein
VAWAAGQGLTLSPGGQAFSHPNSALFVDQLCPETIDEFTEGAGAELNRIQSLRSSSCLVLNVFEPWRKNPRAVGDIFGAETDSLSFEAKQPTGLKGVAPHLDVLLTGSNVSVAIEGKFLEMYTPTENHFAESYFARDDLWAGLENARELAARIADGSEQFRWLHAAQLLKHALGLSKNQQTDFRLVLLWYRVEGLIAEELEAEIGRFARAVSDDFDFTSMTYQELVARLRKVAEPMPGYFGYLEGRYQLDGTWLDRSK